MWSLRTSAYVLVLWSVDVLREGLNMLEEFMFSVYVA